MNAIEIIDLLTATDSTNTRIEILKKYEHDITLQRIFFLAYNPTTVFGIKQIPTTHFGTTPYTIEEALDKLSCITNKEVTGKKASAHLADILSNLQPKEQEVIVNIIGRDLRCHVGKRTVNKVWPGLLRNTAYMGASVYSEKKVDALFKRMDKGTKIYSEVKMDGRYANLTVTEDSYSITSRNGKVNNLLNAFDADVAILRMFSPIPTPFVVCGELLIDDVPRFESNGIISSIVSIGDAKDNVEFERKANEFGDLKSALENLRLVIWDIIPLDIVENNALYKANDKKLATLLPPEDIDEQRIKNVAYKSLFARQNRLEMLCELAIQADLEKIRIVEFIEVKSKQEALQHFQTLLSEGEEGTILKSSDGLWVDGKPTHQIKFKIEMDVELVVTGSNLGKVGKKYEGMIGSYNCESSDGLLKVSANVLGDEAREKNEDLTGKIVTIRCNGLSQSNGNYSMMYPRLVQIRDDKDEADDLPTIKNIEQMIISLS